MEAREQTSRKESGYSDWARRLQDAGLNTLKGFRVEASDGEAGRVEQVLYWTDASMPDFIVVGTGKWFFGRKAVLSVVDIIDVNVAAKMLRVDMSRNEVLSAPEFLPLA